VKLKNAVFERLLAAVALTEPEQSVPEIPSANGVDRAENEGHVHQNQVRGKASADSRRPVVDSSEAERARAGTSMSKVPMENDRWCSLFRAPILMDIYSWNR
jgi:hypothetical protein